tara:strand:+ start:444 stop:1028 length:585 start_codon:yes stop_codon:yes gene_type:complete
MKLVLETRWLKVYDDVLPKIYCDKIIKKQKEKLYNQPLDPENEVEGIRTSMQSFITEGSLDTLINEKTLKITKIPIKQYESTSVIRYKTGEEYKAHHDYFGEIERFADTVAKDGDRLATALFILNGDCEGGETHFPYLDNLKIAPKTGRCIVWQNIFLLNILGEPEISYNEDSLHAGLPVINGEKWIATKWIRY